MKKIYEVAASRGFRPTVVLAALGLCSSLSACDKDTCLGEAQCAEASRSSECARLATPLADDDPIPDQEITVAEFIASMSLEATDIPIEWASTGGDPLFEIEPKEGGTLLSYALSTVAGTATYGTYEKESNDDLDRVVCPPPDLQVEGALRFRTDDGTFDEEWPVDVSAATESLVMIAAVAIEDFSTLNGTFSAELVTEEWQGAIWNPPRGSVFISRTEQGTSGAVGVEVHSEEQTLPDGGTVGFGMGIQLADWYLHE